MIAVLKSQAAVGSSPAEVFALNLEGGGPARVFVENAGGAPLTSGIVQVGGSTQAVLTTALTGTHNDLKFRSALNDGGWRTPPSIEYVVAGLSTPLSVVVTGRKITVNVATNGAGAALSTAAQVRAALLGQTDIPAGATPVSALLGSVELAAGNDGTGVVTALAETPLALAGLIDLDTATFGTLAAAAKAQFLVPAPVGVLRMTAGCGSSTVLNVQVDNAADADA